ncbi:uncharacterized protein LAESUDRAFT_359898 [Laetiporus sulphureus 93-53]|uniref:Uncharacterized protein n=1 Tax=Laetiporus sulphureus 93-53 TaxID=1314785 RepID=A0A165GY18_9APHY|nr:uncharacterized protein LAESUDRAFT_359898 [Laetiporus sulphureus 93-53]KZT10983.1 hypothetical protein LAESUDRAFT_359898 [Laetiporus sulphureus 93-53]
MLTICVLKLGYLGQLCVLDEAVVKPNEAAISSSSLYHEIKIFLGNGRYAYAVMRCDVVMLWDRCPVALKANAVMIVARLTAQIIAMVLSFIRVIPSVVWCSITRILRRILLLMIAGAI